MVTRVNSPGFKFVANHPSVALQCICVNSCRAIRDPHICFGSDGPLVAEYLHTRCVSLAAEAAETTVSASPPPFYSHPVGGVSIWAGKQVEPEGYHHLARYVPVGNGRCHRFPANLGVDSVEFHHVYTTVVTPESIEPLVRDVLRPFIGESPIDMDKVMAWYSAVALFGITDIEDCLTHHVKHVISVYYVPVGDTTPVVEYVDAVAALNGNNGEATNTDDSVDSSRHSIMLGRCHPAEERDFATLPIHEQVLRFYPFIRHDQRACVHKLAGTNHQCKTVMTVEELARCIPLDTTCEIHHSEIGTLCLVGPGVCVSYFGDTSNFAARLLAECRFIVGEGEDNPEDRGTVLFVTNKVTSITLVAPASLKSGQAHGGVTYHGFGDLAAGYVHQWARGKLQGRKDRLQRVACYLVRQMPSGEDICAKDVVAEPTAIFQAEVRRVFNLPPGLLLEIDGQRLAQDTLADVVLRCGARVMVQCSMEDVMRGGKKKRGKTVGKLLHAAGVRKDVTALNNLAKKKFSKKSVQGVARAALQRITPTYAKTIEAGANRAINLGKKLFGKKRRKKGPAVMAGPRNALLEADANNAAANGDLGAIVSADDIRSMAHSILRDMCSDTRISASLAHLSPNALCTLECLACPEQNLNTKIWVDNADGSNPTRTWRVCTTMNFTMRTDANGNGVIALTPCVANDRPQLWYTTGTDLLTTVTPMDNVAAPSIQPGWSNPAPTLSNLPYSTAQLMAQIAYNQTFPSTDTRAVTGRVVLALCTFTYAGEQAEMGGTTVVYRPPWTQNLYGATRQQIQGCDKIIRAGRVADGIYSVFTWPQTVRARSFNPTDGMISWNQGVSSAADAQYFVQMAEFYPLSDGLPLCPAMNATTAFYNGAIDATAWIVGAAGNTNYQCTYYVWVEYAGNDAMTNATNRGNDGGTAGVLSGVMREAMDYLQEHPTALPGYAAAYGWAKFSYDQVATLHG